MPHILLVDDDEDLCYLLGNLLQSQGYTVSFATNGNEAIKKFHKQVPDLILLDLMLPKVSGMEVCWRLRAFSDVPIIIISAKNREEDIFWAIQAGANDYLTKPLDLDEVLLRIKSFLS